MEWCKGTRIIIPKCLRKKILQQLYVGHQGQEKSKHRSMCSMYWPRINKQIEEMVTHCSDCIENQSSQVSELLNPHAVPSSPWQKIGADLCKKDNNDYLVMVYYNSGFPEVYRLSPKTSHAVIKYIKEYFSRAGIPYEVFSDNGPCFSSEELCQFAEVWDFRHNTSSPHFSHSNGEVESYVKPVMKVTRKSADPLYGFAELQGNTTVRRIFTRRGHVWQEATYQSAMHPQEIIQHEAYEEQENIQAKAEG